MELMKRKRSKAAGRWIAKNRHEKPPKLSEIELLELLAGIWKNTPISHRWLKVYEGDFGRLEIAYKPTGISPRP